MRLFLITLAMSTTGAVILIIALLVISCLIGYVTAWFYAKSVYTPIIKGLESDKVQLNIVISGLNDDISKLKNKVEDLNARIEEKEKEISALGKEISEKLNILTEKENEIEELRKKIKDKVL